MSAGFGIQKNVIRATGSIHCFIGLSVETMNSVSVSETEIPMRIKILLRRFLIWKACYRAGVFVREKSLTEKQL